MRSIKALLSTAQELYKQGMTAYWLPPIVAEKDGEPLGRIRAGDSVIFGCRRGEREVQLTEAFTQREFDGFPRERLEPLTFVPLVNYHPRFDVLPTAFRTAPVSDTLGETISKAGLRQIRISEDEKFAHVSYFLNGKLTEPSVGEERMRVSSKLDDPLSVLPALSALVCKQLSTEKYQFIAVNIASGDLVGHSDNRLLKEQCATDVDRTLEELLEAAAKSGYFTILTADHGLLEDHGPLEGPVNTSHTTHPVPFVAIAPNGRAVPVASEGSLADVAPTILHCLDIPAPKAMTGRNLIQALPTKAEKVQLVILDGWGLPVGGHVNPIETATTPTWDRILQMPMAALAASGTAVGLLPGRNGNSESGHMAIGAGRPVLQDDTLIKQAITDGSFFGNPAIAEAFAQATQHDGAVHILAMLSKTSSHGSFEYALELARFSRSINFERLYIHVITDGRSSKSQRLPEDLADASIALDEIGVGKIVTLVGRGLALDRGRSYVEKTKVTYDALVSGEGHAANVDH